MSTTIDYDEASDFEDAYESEPEVTADTQAYHNGMLDFVAWWWTQHANEKKEDSPSRDELLEAHGHLRDAVTAARDDDSDDEDSKSLPYEDNIDPEELERYIRGVKEDLTAELFRQTEGASTPQEAAQRWLLRVTPALRPACVRQKNGRCLRGRIKAVERYRGDEDEVVAAWLKSEGVTEEELAQLEEEEQEEEKQEAGSDSDDSEWEQPSTEDDDDEDFDDEEPPPPAKRLMRHAPSSAQQIVTA